MGGKKNNQNSVNAVQTNKEKNNPSVKKFKIIVSIICVVIVLAIAGAIVYTVFNTGGLYYRITTAMTVGDEKLSIADYNYYYYTVYNNYTTAYADSLNEIGLDTTKPLDQQTKSDDEQGRSWDQFFRDNAEETIKRTYGMVAKAESVGFKLSDDDMKIVDEYIDSIINYCETSDIDLQNHLEEQFGPGANLDLVRKHNELAEIAYKYNEQCMNGYEFTDEEINGAYSQFADSLDTVSYRSFFVTENTGLETSNNNSQEGTTSEASSVIPTSSSNKPNIINTSAQDGTTSMSGEDYADTISDLLGDDASDYPTDNGSSETIVDTQAVERAKQRAEQLIANVKTEDDFKNMVINNVSEAVKEDYENSDLTLKQNELLINLSVTDAQVWLADPSRENGDIGIVESSSGVYIIYFISRQAFDVPTVNMRHILVQPESDSSQTSETINTQNEAHNYAEWILSEWEKGAKTEDSFALLATQYSVDTATSANGGLYTAFYAGLAPESVDEWCFDENRQPGDVTIIDSEMGSHIIYFVSKGDVYWKEQIINYLKNQRAEDEITVSYEDIQLVQKSGYNKTGKIVENA